MKKRYVNRRDVTSIQHSLTDTSIFVLLIVVRFCTSLAQPQFHLYDLLQDVWKADVAQHAVQYLSYHCVVHWGRRNMEVNHTSLVLENYWGYKVLINTVIL